MKAKIIPAILVLIVFLGSAIGAEAQSPSATLSSGSGSGMAGDTGISIPVTIYSAPGTQVSGLNFDLTFDSSRLSVSSVNIGSAASSAGKSITESYPSAGTVRVLIFGFNQTAIPNGTVATIVFNVNAIASPGTSSLSLSNAAASDPGGAGVTLSLSNGSFTVTAPPPTSTPVPPPSDTPVPTNTRTPTSTQAPAVGATQTPTLPATNTSSAPSFSSPTLTPTLISISENTPAFSPTVDMTASPSIEIGSATGSDEAVSKEMAQSIEMSIVATMTALADLDAQVAATATALAKSAGEMEEPTGDSVAGGGLIFSNLLMWPAILAIGAGGAVILSIIGSRAVLKRRRASDLRM